MVPLTDFIQSADFQAMTDVDLAESRAIIWTPGIVCYLRHWQHLWDRVQHPTVPYVLVSNYTDRCVEGSVAERILADPLLLRWYAVNAVMSHPKLTPIPFGLRQVKPLRLIDAKPKDILCYANFRRHSPWRHEAWTWAQGQRWVTCREWNKHEPVRYLQDVARSHFVMCPAGHGPDTFRLWEALALGAVPIVCGRVLAPLIDPLPVLRVDAWDEVTAPRLAIIYDNVLKECGWTWDILRRAYWQGEIRGHGRG